MSDNPFGWLWKDESPAEPAIKVPEGGDFVTGFAGSWTISPLYKFWVAEEVDTSELKGDHLQKLNNGTNVYFRPANHSQAVESAKMAGLKYGPNAVLRWEMPTTTMLNFGGDDATATFGDTIAFDAKMSSLFGATKHEYHMLFLPSAVQELAITSGLLKERIYDYDGLLTDADGVTEEYQQRMIGGEKDWEQSELWQARVKIWQALGESDPKRYTVGQKGKTDVESKMLAGCLGLTTRAESKLWARVARVANPKIPAEGKRNYGIHVIARIWTGREAAVAEMGENNKAETSSDGTAYPPMPEGWDGASANDFIEWANEYTANLKLKGKPMAMVEKTLNAKSKELEEQYACAPADVIAWWPFLHK